VKLLYKPFSMIASVLAARIGKTIFRGLWSQIDTGEPPAATAPNASLPKVVGAAALEAPRCELVAHPVGDTGLGELLALDQHVAEDPFDDEIAVAADLVLADDAGGAQLGNADPERQQLVEVCWASEAHLRLGDDHVDAPVEHRLVAPEGRSPQLGEARVEVRQVVRVEHDPLGIALRVTDAELMGERLAHAFAPR
jgi:hypothetical protein